MRAPGLPARRVARLASLVDVMPSVTRPLWPRTDARGRSGPDAHRARTRRMSRSGDRSTPSPCMRGDSAGARCASCATAGSSSSMRRGPSSTTLKRIPSKSVTCRPPGPDSSTRCAPRCRASTRDRTGVRHDAISGYAGRPRAPRGARLHERHDLAHAWSRQGSEGYIEGTTPRVAARASDAFRR